MRLLQQLQGIADVGAAALGIVGHFVEPLAIVVVLQLPEGLHGFVQVVVDEGIAVARILLEGLPADIVQTLAVVHQVHAALQHLGASQRREAVEVQADDEVGIESHHGSQLVVDVLLDEVQLLELLVVEVEVRVFVII